MSKTTVVKFQRPNGRKVHDNQELSTALTPKGAESAGRSRQLKTSRARVSRREKAPFGGSNGNVLDVRILVKCAEAILQVSTQFGFKNRRSLKVSCDRFATLWESWCGPQLSWIQLMKYKLAAFYASVKLQALPPRPEGVPDTDRPDIILGGAHYRWLRLFKRTATSLDWHSYCLSVKSSKSAMPRPDWFDCAVAGNEGFEKLTSERKVSDGKFLLPWADVPARGMENVGITLSVDTARKAIRRTVTEIFQGKKFSTEDLIPSVPSTSACFTHSRLAGGSYGAILGKYTAECGDGMICQDSYLPAKRSLSFAVGVNHVHSRGNFQDTENHHEGRDGAEYIGLSSFDEVEMSCGGTIEKARALYSTAMRSALRATTLSRNFPFTSYKRRARRYIGPGRLPEPEDRPLPQGDPLAVRISPLSEALKVRNITAGNAEVSWVLAPLQKWLWSTLRNDPSHVFDLIGQPEDETFLERTLGTRALADDEEVISVDYSDCTNNIMPWASEEVADTLLDLGAISKEYHALLVGALTGHTIRCPWDTEKFSRQMHGQLMGSVVSFPVLCIVNASLLRWTTEISRRRSLPLREAHICVNGDDGLCRLRFGGYETLRRIANFMGLPLSVGKVFRSREFFDINSREFLIVPARTGKHRFVRVPFINNRMVGGVARSEVPTGPATRKSEFTKEEESVMRWMPHDLLDLPAYPFIVAKTLPKTSEVYIRHRKGLSIKPHHIRSATKDCPALIPMKKWIKGKKSAKPKAISESEIVGDGNSWPLGKTVHDYLESAPVAVRKSIYALLLASMKERLPRGIPWFMPIELGGLGLPLLWSDGHVGPRVLDTGLRGLGAPPLLEDTPTVDDVSVTFGPSKLDLQIASAVLCQLAQGRLPPLKEREKVDWHLFRRRRALLPLPEVVTTHAKESDILRTRQVDKILTLEVFLTSSLSDVFDPPLHPDKARTTGKSYRTRRRLWDPKSYARIPGAGSLPSTPWFVSTQVQTVTPVTILNKETWG